MTEPPSNNLSWRVTVLEREVQSLKDGKPDVIAERVATLTLRLAEFRAEVEKDMGEMRAEVATTRRILVGFCTTLAVALILAVLLRQYGV